MTERNPDFVPEYPGQIEPVWVWWSRDEPEDGLVGFHTAQDRDNFSTGGLGPFRRRVSPTGKTISQLEGWSDMVRRWTQEPTTDAAPAWEQTPSNDMASDKRCPYGSREG